MKANRKFLHGDEDAVSPVIAVILMVAITVVLAATVYVWVSGFGSGGGNTPAHTLALTSAGAITGVDPDSDDDFDYYYKAFTIASADPSLTYGDMKITLAGSEIQFLADTDSDCDSATDVAAALNTDAAAEWAACGGTSERASDDLVQAGDKLYVVQATEAALSGQEFIVLDNQANSVMLTLTIR